MSQPFEKFENEDDRTNQQRIADEGTGILSKYGVVYLAMEVRCGKTLTALEIARQMVQHINPQD